MYLLLSGEGPTDLGVNAGAAMVGEGEEYHPGPMAVIIDQLVEARFDYSPLETQSCGFIAEHDVAALAGDLKAPKKAMALPGHKRAKETRYFFNNARILARVARDQEARHNVEVVAVLFRDSDGTASAGRGLWAEKRDSMLHGFAEEGFERGVPMLPKPKSEALILCALKYMYQACDALEERSGNDASPNSLKAELEQFLGRWPSREELCDMVRTGAIDFRQIDMPSFTAFRSRLDEVLAGKHPRVRPRGGG